MTKQELIELYTIWKQYPSEREYVNLQGVDLSNINLCDINLSGANLHGVNLHSTYLSGANLRGADLHCANLRNANLRGADLSGAYLRSANLNGANIRDADLSGADLDGANLSDANLSDASLHGANLCCANLCGVGLRDADLSNTCLDQNVEIPSIDDQLIIDAGLSIDGEYVYGYRTKRSQVCGSTIYEVGQTYTAEYFSVSDTECHPGIYLADLNWLQINYRDQPLVKVRCLRSDLHKAGLKWRCKKLEVLEDID